jgi:hypothetical protein
MIYRASELCQSQTVLSFFFPRAAARRRGCAGLPVRGAALVPGWDWARTGIFTRAAGRLAPECCILTFLYLLGA